MAPEFRLWSPLLRPFGTRSVAFRGHARFPPSPLRFRRSGFPHYGSKRPLRPMPARARLRLLVTAFCPLCVGPRVRRRRAPGRPVKCARTSPVARAVCIGLRVWHCRIRFPRLCVLAAALRHTMDRPRALSSSAVMLSAASLVLRPDLPDSRPRSEFAHGAYTDRPAVRGRSRRDPSPSRLCVVCLPLVPLSIRRRDSPAALARLFTGGISLRPLGPGSAPS